MDSTFEQRVREKAYEIWVSAGMGDGQAHEHWLIAERAIVSEIGIEPAESKRASRAGGTAKVAAKSLPKAPAKRASKAKARH